MNVVLTRDVAKASKIEEKSGDKNRLVATENDKVSKDGIVCNEHRPMDNNNKNIAEDGPKPDKETEMLKKQYAELLEINRLLKKQLDSRDAIIKRQISEIHRLQGENKNLEKEKGDVKGEFIDLKKEFETEKWLTERLKHDIRDLQMQLDFQDCYLQEQSHQSSLLESLLGELQKKGEAQEKEITQLRQQLHSGKEKLDTQIVDLQKMLGIQAHKRR